MKSKILIPIISSIIGILLIINTTCVNGVNLSLVDETQDIIHMIDGVTSATNQTGYPEIDIVSLEMNESTVAVTFLNTPVLSIDNFYDFIVYWNGDQKGNFTDGHWNQGNIISQTYLVNSTGDIIVNTKANDSIAIIGNTLYYPILNASLIVTDLNPINMIMDARQRDGTGPDFYQDTLEYNTGESVPSFSFVASIIGIATLTTTVIISRKKH